MWWGARIHISIPRIGGLLKRGSLQCLHKTKCIPRGSLERRQHRHCIRGSRELRTPGLVPSVTAIATTTATMAMPTTTIVVVVGGTIRRRLGGRRRWGAVSLERLTSATREVSSLRTRSRASMNLIVYSVADWAGCPDTRCSMSGYCAYLGGNFISWSSKRQHTVSRFSAEAEYRGAANVVAKSCWLRQLLDELGYPPWCSIAVFCDNVSASYMSSNPGQPKHIEIDLYFVREKVSLGEVKVLPSSAICRYFH
jgi:hypothetical protein